MRNIYRHYWTKWKRLVELGRTLPFYKNATFRKADLALYRRYLWNNPYTISRKYLQSRGESNIHMYGETPLSTLAKIAKEAEISPEDHIYDLGCGPGRTSLWFRLFTGATVTGIEQIPTFVENAKATTSHIDDLTFSQEDMFLSDYSKATVVYLYGTCLTEPEIEKLTEQLRSLPEGSRIISVSYPLDFPVIKQFPAKFPWGKADVYLHSVADLT